MPDNKNKQEKKRLTREEAEALAPSTCEEQIDHKGPIPRDKQLSPKDRHKAAASDLVWENVDATSKLIAITLPDYACPSFCTFDQDCFGEAPALRAVCQSEDESHISYAKRANARYKTQEEIEEAKEKGHWRKEESDMLAHLDRALQGEQITWSSMGCATLVPDMNPDVIAKAIISEDDFSFLHYNVWDWTYFFTAEHVETEVIWVIYHPQRYIFKDKPFYEDPNSATYKNAMANAILSTEYEPKPRYVRAMRTKMEKPNHAYGGDSILVKEGNVSFGDADRFYTRLYMIDKRFDSEDEMREDIENFDPMDINYGSMFGQMLGDG